MASSQGDSTAGFAPSSPTSSTRAPDSGKPATPPDAVATEPSNSVDALLDCRGLRCPLPVIELAKELSGVPVGGTIRVLADDPAAAVDIPAWCRMRGHTLIGEITHGGSPAFDVRRNS